MITSTYGIKIMEDGDKGQPVFDAMNDNFEWSRDHTHNGSNSAQIASSALTKGSVNLNTGDWVSIAGGRGYEQTVTCPGVYTLANSQIRFRVRSGTHIHKIIQPTIVPSSVTQFKVIVNDSSLELEALFV